LVKHIDTINGRDVQRQNVVNNVDKLGLWALWQNGPYKNAQNIVKHEVYKDATDIKNYLFFVGFFGKKTKENRALSHSKPVPHCQIEPCALHPEMLELFSGIKYLLCRPSPIVTHYVFYTWYFWLAVHGKPVLFWNGTSGLKVSLLSFYACERDGPIRVSGGSDIIT